MPEVREIGDRDAVHLQHRVPVFDLLVLEILDRRESADLPERRPGRILGAEIAGGIHDTRQFVDLTLGASRPVGSEPAILGQERAHVAQHAVLHILGEFRVVGEQHLAVGLQQDNISLRRGDPGVAVEGDPVGAKHLVVLPGLDVTLGDHQCVLPVVFHRIGGEADRLVARGGRLRAGTGQLAELRANRGGRQCHEQQCQERQAPDERA